MIERRNDEWENAAARARMVGLKVHAYGFDRYCDWCGGPLPVQLHQGQPRRWCSEACRHKAYRQEAQ
jgi:hypothetical protein